MTSAIPPSSSIPPTSTATPQTATTAPAADTTASPSGAVPAQRPVKSYATATKTATPPTSAGASAPAQNAKSVPDSQMNGAMAQGGSQNHTQNGMTNGTPAHGDHGRKSSVVINAQGVYGSTSNGGPVAPNKPSINFGSINNQGPEPQANQQLHPQSSSLPAPPRDPRINTPSHSPSPIPQPPASGGRPPSGLETQTNGLRFGSIGPDGDMMRGGPMPQGPMGHMPMHERRPSSQSMHSDMSNQGMPPNYNRANMMPQNAGRGAGRGFAQQPSFMQSPGAQYRPMPVQQGRNNMPPFQQQPPPGSPFNTRARASPVPNPVQPHMGQSHMGGNPQMHYSGYPQHLNPQHQQMYNMPGYDPNSGYYNPYMYGGYGGQQPPQSPRPQFPSPFQNPQGQMAPFHPPPTPGMARTPSQHSERPPSSVGHPQNSAQHAPPPSHTPGPGPQSQSTPVNNFVRPVKKSNAIKITDAQGNAVDFKKTPSTPSAQSQPQAPVIVSTPHAPTPPPRAPSTQTNRSDSRPANAKSSEETKASFAEQVKRKKEEEDAKAKQQTEDAKSKADAEPEAPANDQVKAARADAEKAGPKPEAPVNDQVKAATAEAEKAAAVAAGDEKAKDDAEAAAKAVPKEDDDKTVKEETEEERIEREIAEMEAEEEAREREEQEREKAYQAKKAKNREAAAAREKESAANADEDLKRQEREAEERELERERERDAESRKDDEPDDESKALFASLKKPNLGPGASEQGSGAETPASEDTPADTNAETASSAQSQPAQGRSIVGQKPKPAHLKLETNKPVERAEPTPGMQALKSARFLEVKEEAKYPEGFKSPNPALNDASQRKGRAYDKDFLLQFQRIFKEKPSVDWDRKVKETLGSDDPRSAQSAAPKNTPGGLSSRQPSRTGAGPMNFGGVMGSFGGSARGTTSQDRFAAATMGPGMGMPPRAGAPGIQRAPSQIGMGTPGVGMSRTNSVQMMSSMGAQNSPRQPSSRGGAGRGGSSSKRDDRTRSKRDDHEMAAKMPLTAHMEIAPLAPSQTGWKATSLGSAPVGPDLSGHLEPPLVQRKVKAALNKMTPEKFDKISDQILEIAAQSKNETDGRTLRQVIQLTFEKATDEAHWAGMYAQFCHKMLRTMSNDIRDETIKDKSGNPVIGGALFRKYLLNRCQEEFERGWQANLPDKPEGETQEAALLSDAYYIAAAAKRRGLGLIQFIGQLYKLRMLTFRIMHECVYRLLNFEGEPDEAAIENLTTLLKSVGATMATEEQGPSSLDLFFKRIDEVILTESLPSRPRFMILDLIDLRKAGWKGKDDTKGPKTIQQIHEEAEAAKARAEMERHTQGQRGGPGGRMPQGRGDARGFSGGHMPPPQDYNKTSVHMDDLRKLQNRSSQRPSGGGLGPSLGPGSALGARAGSRRGVGLGPSSGNTTRTNTPPVDTKSQEPTQTNAFSALAALDPSGEGPEETADAASPPASRDTDKAESTTA